MANQNSIPDFSLLIDCEEYNEYKRNLFLSSRLYTLDIKKKFISTLLENKVEEEQNYILTGFKKYFTPPDSKPNNYPIDSSSSVSEIELFGVQSDFPIEERQKHNHGLDTFKLVKWIDELLDQFSATPLTRIKCGFHPSEFAFLFKLLIEKGWIQADFDNKQNIVKLSKILLDTFEVKSPDGKLVTAIALADKFNEKRNKAHSEYKTDLRKGILNIAHYRKGKPSN